MIWLAFFIGILAAAAILAGIALYVAFAVDERARRDLSNEEDWLL